MLLRTAVVADLTQNQMIGITDPILYINRQVQTSSYKIFFKLQSPLKINDCLHETKSGLELLTLLTQGANEVLWAIYELLLQAIFRMIASLISDFTARVAVDDGMKMVVCSRVKRDNSMDVPPTDQENTYAVRRPERQIQ